MKVKKENLTPQALQTQTKSLWASKILTKEQWWLKVSKKAKMRMMMKKIEETSKVENKTFKMKRMSKTSLNICKNNMPNKWIEDNLAMKNKHYSNSIIRMNTDREFMSMKRWKNKKVEVEWKKTKMGKMRKIMTKMRQTSNQSSTHSINSRTSKKWTKMVI